MLEFRLVLKLEKKKQFETQFSHLNFYIEKLIVIGRF